MDIEYAFHARDTGIVPIDQRRLKTRNSPRWWLERAGLLDHRQAATTAPRPAAAPRRPAAAPTQRVYSGWVSGVCNPGLSVDAHASFDGERLREQFTPAALNGILTAVRSGKMLVKLTYDHGGIELARSPLDLTFRMNAILGLTFDARLPDTATARQVLAEIGTDGLGVSIAYRVHKWWHIDREGVGKVRVIDAATLDHVAILPRSHRSGPAYEGARCYCVIGNRPGPSREAINRAEQHAFKLMKRQAGCDV